MTLARAWSVALIGVRGSVVEVEADLAQGLPGLSLIGLPDAALSESRDRVRAAVVNSGEAWPQRRITLGLSPATLPKAGSGFDLAMAVAVLCAAGVVPPAELAGRVLLGELGLDGRVRPVRGVLPATLAAVDAGFERVVVPRACAAEAVLVPGAQVLPVGSLRELLAVLRGEAPPAELPPAPPPGPDDGTGDGPDLADVLGQPAARRAVEVVAAGGHHCYLWGPPGVGKTMLAERLPGLLPALTPADALEVTAVHSVAGVLPPGDPLVRRPPFRAPHHTATVAALVGGGSRGALRPGLASQAHRGVLFLDEAPEFRTGVLDALRQPLESGRVEVARAGVAALFPARFALVLAANPCPCARTSDSGLDCTCPPAVRRRYLARLSGPLLDRVDVQVQMFRVGRAALLADRGGAEGSGSVAARVAAARARAGERLRGTPWRTNAEVPGAELRRRWPVPARALGQVSGLRGSRLTARGLDRVLRIAWTLADLEGAAAPGSDHVGEAVGLRLGTL